MKSKLLAFVLCLSVLLGACGQGTPANTNSQSLEPLTIGLMPAVDAAPILIAEQEGYFAELGLTVELTVYNNALDRQAALQSGQIDGTISDIVALINNVSNGFPIKATSCTDGSFLIVTGESFSESAETVKVGLMEVSVVNYLADQFLGDSYQLDKVYINDIPARIEMLAKGQIDAAVLPEPIATNAQLAGLDKKAYPYSDQYSPELLVFTANALTAKSASLMAFHQAYNKAVDYCNANTDAVRTILVEKIGVTPEAKDLMQLPEYNRTMLPDEAYVSKLTDWIEQTMGTEIQAAYADFIDGSFIQ